MKGKKPSARRSARSSGRIAEVLGCKWSVEVLRLVRAGVERPGALERAVPGLSTKVLNQRLAKLVRLGLLSRTAFPEVPPRVVYRLTERGMRLGHLLDAIAALEAELDGEADAQVAPSASATGVRMPSP